MKRTIIIILFTIFVGNMMYADNWEQVANWNRDSVQLIKTSNNRYYLVQDSNTFDIGNYAEMIMLCTDIVKVWDYLKTNDTFSIDNYQITKKEKLIEIKCSNGGTIKIDSSIFTDILIMKK